jgi:hypothetical protein
MQSSWTVLGYAALKSDIATVKALVELGANVDAGLEVTATP